jgi:hypothetical protein
MKALQILSLAVAVAASATPAPAATPLGGEFLLSASAVGHQNWPDVAVAPDGSFVVVWRSGPWGAGDLYAQRFDASGVRIGGEITITSVSNDVRHPVIALKPDGGFVVAWEEDAALDITWVRSFDSSGLPTTAAIQIDPTVALDWHPAVATGPDGSFAVSLESYYDVWVQRFDTLGVADGSPFMANVFTTGTQGGTRIGIDGNKDIVVTWSSPNQDGDGSGVYARRFTWAGAGGSEFLVNTTTTGNQASPDVAIMPDNRYVITWSSYLQDGDGYGVYAQRFSSSDMKLGPEFRANTYTTNNQMNSRVATNLSGGFTIVWSSDGQDGYGYGVYGQQFLSDGTFDGSEYRVNTTTAGRQTAQEISIGAQGVVVWEGGLNTDSLDVFGQRYFSPLSEPDLTVSLAGPSEITDGSAAFACSVTVTNSGAPCGQFRTIVGMSTDAYFNENDLWFSADTILALSRDEDSTYVVTGYVTTDLGPGQVYLGAYVDDLAEVDESNEANNIGATSLQLTLPVIYSVEDVHGDQGGYVHLKWWADPLDDPAMGMHISEYTVWRAIDIYSAAALLESGAARLFDPGAPREDRSGSAASRAPRTRLLRPDPGAAAYIFWELVWTQPALAFSGYAETIPTLFDSTSVNSDYHYFQVIAHLDTVSYPYHVSAMDSARSTDDLPPGAPLNLAGEQTEAEGLELTWDANLESDLAGYRVHRGTDAGFTPGSGNQIGAPFTPEWFDPGWRWDGGFYYKVCAVDAHENKSDYTLLGPDLVTGAGGGSPRLETALDQNQPNPFNPVTTIRYTIERAGPVRLVIYNSAGQRVRTLVDTIRRAGVYVERWNGRDDRGRAVASGVYFYRLEAPPFVQTRKMVLLK